MKSFELFYGLNLGYTLYNMTDNLSKTIQKENCFAIDGQRSANLTLQALQGMRTMVAKPFYEAIGKKASKHPFIESPNLPRKRKRHNYKTIEEHFQRRIQLQW